MFNEIILHDFAKPLRARKEMRRYCGPYRWKPAQPGKGYGFYMQHDVRHLETARHGSRFRLRVEEAGPSWTFGYGEDPFTPIILRLPHGRGFLAGWTLGAGMCASVDGYVWHDEDDAKRAARDEAERACEAEAEYWARELDSEEDDEE